MHDKSQITKLEKTIVELAAGYVSDYEYYARSNDLEEAGSSIYALLPLLMLGHLADSGISQEARDQLLELESQYHSKLPWKQTLEENQSAAVPSKFQRIEDIDSELISSVLWEFYAEYEQGDHDVPLTIADVELLPEAAMQDLGGGGEPLVEIKVNIAKLEQLQAKIKAKKQIAETKREPLETHTDKQTRTYLFNVSCEKAMLMLLLNANSKRQSTGEPEIAPTELLNRMSAYQLEGRAPMRAMVTCSIDLNVVKKALKFAKQSELEAEKDKPNANLFAWDYRNSKDEE